MLNKNARDWILGVFILGGPICLWILLPEDILIPAAVGLLAFSVLGVLGIRKYVERLDNAAGVLAKIPDQAAKSRVNVLAPRERSVLGLADVMHPVRAIRVLERRRDQLGSIGLFIGVCGLVAFILLVIIFAD